MSREQEQQLVDYYSTTDKYIRSQLHSNAYQSVFTKENDRYQWLVLEQKSQNQVEVRQTDNHGTITARDNYELTRNIPKCVGVERLCRDVNMQIPFNADEINLIYQFGGTGQSGNVRKLICHSPTGKGQRHKADNKRHFEEIKCPVRRNVCRVDRHHQKTENCRA